MKEEATIEMKKKKNYVMFGLCIVCWLLWPLGVSLAVGGEGFLPVAINIIIISAVIFVSFMRSQIFPMIIAICVVVSLISLNNWIFGDSIMTTIVLTMYSISFFAGLIALVSYEPIFRHFDK